MYDGGVFGGYASCRGCFPYHFRVVYLTCALCSKDLYYYSDLLNRYKPKVSGVEKWCFTPFINVQGMGGFCNVWSIRRLHSMGCSISHHLCAVHVVDSLRYDDNLYNHARILTVA